MPWFIDVDIDPARWLGPYEDQAQAVEDCVTWAPNCTVRWRDE